jgi:hypothetical protein
MKKLNKTDIAILIVIVIALPFVFKPDLMTETLELVFKFLVVSVLILIVVIEGWHYFKKK